MVDHDLINNILIYRSSGQNSPSMASSFTISILCTTTKPMYVTKTNSSFSFVSSSVFLEGLYDHLLEILPDHLHPTLDILPVLNHFYYQFSIHASV